MEFEIRRTILAFLLMPLNLFSQEGDSLYLKFFGNDVFKNLEVKTFEIFDNEGKSIFKDMKFAKPVGEYLQVIDAKNKAFYLDQNLDRHGDKGDLEDVEQFIGLCGTVPHYELLIKEGEHEFVVLEDETFYDHENKKPAEKIATIAKSEADKVFFINGKQEFKFNENYGVGLYHKTFPRTLVYLKNKRYGIIDSLNNQLYDNVEFWDEHSLLVLYSKGLMTFYGINDNIPKYSVVSRFFNHLALFVLPDGTKGFLDSEGNEYFDK